MKSKKIHAQLQHYEKKISKNTTEFVLFSQSTSGHGGWPQEWFMYPSGGKCGFFFLFVLFWIVCFRKWEDSSGLGNGACVHFSHVTQICVGSLLTRSL